jgi:hypothetical protein
MGDVTETPSQSQIGGSHRPHEDGGDGQQDGERDDEDDHPAPANHQALFRHAPPQATRTASATSGSQGATFSSR